MGRSLGRRRNGGSRRVSFGFKRHAISGPSSRDRAGAGRAGALETDNAGRAAPVDRVGRAIREWAAARPDLDVSSSAVVARVSRLAELIHPEIERVLAPRSISRGDFDVLGALRRSGPAGALPLGALAGRVFRTAGTMSVRVDRLEARGLVCRRPDPSDGRGVLVELTSSGREAVDAALAEHLANQERLLAPLDPVERERLADLLARLLAPLEERT